MPAVIRFLEVRTRNGHEVVTQARRAELGEFTKSEHHAGAAYPGKIAGAEVRTGRIDFRVLPVIQVETLYGEVLGQTDGQVCHAFGQQRFAQFGTRDSQGADIDRIDGVDAVLYEGALAPADQLLSQAELPGRVGNVETGKDVGIKQLHIFAH